jgi:hypothetical protein
MKIVKVKWIDSMGTAGWGEGDSSDMRCCTVGILHKKTKKSVIIALNQSAYGRGHFIEIPKVAIKKIKKLKK